MSKNAKIRYEIDLSDSRPFVDAGDVEIRQLTPADRSTLAHLMLDAYVGTIDDEGETIAEAIDEVDSWLEGSPLLDHSFCALKRDHLISAVLVMNVDDGPFVAYVMTDPDHKGKRLARAVVESALTSLALAPVTNGLCSTSPGVTRLQRDSSLLLAHTRYRPSNAPTAARVERNLGRSRTRLLL